MRDGGGAVDSLNGEGSAAEDLVEFDHMKGWICKGATFGVVVDEPGFLLCYRVVSILVELGNVAIIVAEG